MSRHPCLNSRSITWRPTLSSYFLVLVFWMVSSHALAAIAPGVITTVAGKTTFTGEIATQTRLDLPSDVVVDAASNLYIANGNRVDKVTPLGLIKTVAGNGIRGFSGDGGVATAAQLNFPSDIAVDGSGNLYIADLNNHRIRKVDTSGVITTVAGNGVVDVNGNSGFSGDGGAATAAQLNFPSDIAVDGSGNLYIADSGNHRIRKVDTSGVITTVAGNGVVDANGNSGFSGDGGVATAAQLDFPSGIALDGSGNLYIADSGNHSIRKINAAGIIKTVAGKGLIDAIRSIGINIDLTVIQLNFPRGIALGGAGNLYIADAGFNRIRKIDTAGMITTVAGNKVTILTSGDGGLATAAQLYNPQGIAIDGAGNLYIADTWNYRIRKVYTSGVITTVAGNGVGDVNGNSSFSGDGGLATAAQLNNPQGIAVDVAGNLYIADTWNHRIRKVDTAGIITTVAGNVYIGFNGDGGLATAAQLSNPQGIAVDGAGNLYIADTWNYRIRKVDTSGVITTVAGNGSTGSNGDGGAATSAQLNNPQGIAVDGAGNLYIADSGNYRIRKVDTVGMITTVAGNGSAGFNGDGGLATAAQLKYPQGIGVDGAGNLYIADAENHRIRKVDTAGVITTVAGNGMVNADGESNFSGDDGAAIAAQLNNPTDIAVDRVGNLYIADSGNRRIRFVQADTEIRSTKKSGGGSLGWAVLSALLLLTLRRRRCFSKRVVRHSVAV